MILRSKSSRVISLAEQPSQRPLLLLDGMSLAFRAFYALSTDIATSSGLITNALHGFASMLHSLIRSQAPGSLAVAFDLPGGTFRDAMTDDYKGGRAETPVEIEHQFDLIREMCVALNIPVVSTPGFEADDILATLATMARDAHMPVIVVTGDRDSFQLVEDPYVRVLYNRRGVSDYSLYDEAGIFERCGIEPQRYPLLAALRGDTSDNLPGVPGVGEKTAAKLFSQYRDLDDLYANVAALTPKLRENLVTYEDRARQNVRIMQLVRDVPIEVTLEDLVLGGWDHASVAGFFSRYEMSAMAARFDKLIAQGSIGSAQTAPTVSSPTAVVQPRTELRAVSTFEEVAGPSLFVHAQAGRLAVANADNGVVFVGALDESLQRCGDAGLSGHDTKPLFRRAEELGIGLGVAVMDTSIMAFLVDATAGRFELPALTARYLNRDLVQHTPSLFEDAIADEQLIEQVAAVIDLTKVLSLEIERLGLAFVLNDIEMPLVRVLGRMEGRGVTVDAALLRSIMEEFSAEASALEARIQDIAGHSFKVNSPSQLAVVLFEELGLPHGKKTKTGYSTDAATLEGLMGAHEIIPHILRYREVEKLRSTYGLPLIDSVSSDGRIHATFHQTVARTGRLSSDNPNLHNIPVRSLEGKRLRKAFLPASGWELCVADYDQIELRILAHLSQDQGLLVAFASGEDVHRRIAASVFGVAPADVTHEQREQAKAVSYGLAYGMEAFGLSQRLGISVGEARDIMNRYFAGFPSIRSYMDETIESIRSEGFSRTEFGRLRPFPDLATASGPARAAAERQAMNAGIQGLAADIFKLALVRLDQRLSAEQLEARLILQFHDEVLVEAPPHEHAAVEQAVIESLTSVATLSVPLLVSLSWGKNWAAAKG